MLTIRMHWKKLLFAFSVALNLVLVGYLLFSSNGWHHYSSLKSDTQQFRAKLASLEDEAYALSHEIRLLQNDTGYIEKIIRKRLGFVRPNEVIYIYPNSQQSAGAGE